MMFSYKKSNPNLPFVEHPVKETTFGNPLIFLIAPLGWGMCVVAGDPVCVCVDTGD